MQVPYQLIWFHQPFLWLMISDEGEGFVAQVTTKMRFSPYFYKAFLFIKIVLGFCVIVGTYNICDYKLFPFIIHLGKYYSKT